MSTKPSHYTIAHEVDRMAAPTVRKFNLDKWSKPIGLLQALAVVKLPSANYNTGGENVYAKDAFVSEVRVR